MIYTVNIQDIEVALETLGGEARAKDIQDQILLANCDNNVPKNYKSERSFRQTIQRKIEDYCPDAEGFDSTKRDEKFLRISHGVYRFVSKANFKEFPAIEEIVATEAIFEGAIRTVSVNVYERNPEARKKCISFYGWKCMACGFDFEKTYGELGKAFIHVHHIKPLSEIQAEYVIDPINDLRPLCANCHAMVHRVKPALSISQLKDALVGAK
jgi:5-methylcytosine-specific restriction enzyme A